MEALTDIKYGKEDGSVVYIEAGSDDLSELPDDVVEDLREAGAVGEGMTTEDQERLRQLEAEVEALRSQLAAQATPSERGSTDPQSLGLAPDAPKENADEVEATEVQPEDNYAPGEPQ